jgi:hypothetical protein
MVPTSTLMCRISSGSKPEPCMFHLTILGLCWRYMTLFFEIHDTPFQGDFRKKAPSRLLIGAVWFEHVYL